MYEIEDKLLKLAKETETNIEVVRELWENTYAGIIRFVPDIKPKETVILESELRDPDDIPFLRLASLLKPEWFFSQDKDLSDLGVAESSYVNVSIDLREFHAGQSITYSFIVGGQMFTLIGGSAIYAFLKALRALFTVLKKSPTWVKIALVAMLLLAISSSRLRQKLKSLIGGVPQLLREAKPVLADILENSFEYLDQGESIKRRGVEKLKQRQSVMNEIEKPMTAEQHIIQVLAHSPEPLSVSLISHLVRSNGYNTSNERFDAYVCKILKSRSIFSQTDDGRWILGSIHEVASTIDKE